MRLLWAGLASICAVLVVLLLFKSPTADFGPAAGGSGTVSVECSPVIRVGWPSDFSGLQPVLTSLFSAVALTRRDAGALTGAQDEPSRP